MKFVMKCLMAQGQVHSYSVVLLPQELWLNRTCFLIQLTQTGKKLHPFLKQFHIQCQFSPRRSAIRMLKFNFQHFGTSCMKISLTRAEIWASKFGYLHPEDQQLYLHSTYKKSKRFKPLPGFPMRQKSPTFLWTDATKYFNMLGFYKHQFCVRYLQGGN